MRFAMYGELQVSSAAAGRARRKDAANGASRRRSAGDAMGPPWAMDALLAGRLLLKGIHHMTAVDDHDAAGHVAARVGGEQEQGSVEVRGRSDAALRHALGDQGARV